ncbi:hypothetical protein BC938DRAFT_475834, partial [Jimgerdemannia flammicorona]
MAISPTRLPPAHTTLNPTMPANAATVPTEIIVAITSYLWLTDKVRFAAATKWLDRIIYDSSELWRDIDFAREFNDRPKKKSELVNENIKR